MAAIDEERIRKYVLEFLENNSTYGKEVFSMVTDETDLFSSGLISSIGFIELISGLEKQFSVEFDFENTNPEEYATICGIMDYIGRRKTSDPVKPAGNQ